jgi:small subunit ribosomal protein S18
LSEETRSRDNDSRERRDSRSSRDSRSRGGGRDFSSRGGRGGRRRRRVCQFCADKVSSIDYKDARMLQQFVSRSGAISPRRRTGTCAKHQRMLAQAIKRARHIALLPFVSGQGRG